MEVIMQVDYGQMALASQVLRRQLTELAAIAKAAGELADEWSTGLRDLERSLAQGWPQ